MAYQVNNSENKNVILMTHKVSGGIYRRYLDDGRIVAVLERSRAGRLVYEECNYGFDDLDNRRITKEDAERILDVSMANQQLRDAILKGIE